MKKIKYNLEKQVLEKLPFKNGLYIYNPIKRKINFNRYNSNLDEKIFEEIKEQEIILDIFNNVVYRILKD